MGGTITSKCIECGIPIDVDMYEPAPHSQRCDDCLADLIDYLARKVSSKGKWILTKIEKDDLRKEDLRAEARIMKQEENDEITVKIKEGKDE
jgi:recombinational DNA repair protein (RecF pathway)